jgi:hypothetical protein
MTGLPAVDAAEPRDLRKTPAPNHPERQPAEATHTHGTDAGFFSEAEPAGAR